MDRDTFAPWLPTRVTFTPIPIAVQLLPPVYPGVTTNPFAVGSMVIELSSPPNSRALIEADLSSVDTGRGLLLGPAMRSPPVS